jgi:hypothetical protein
MKRRRFKQTQSLQERLAEEAKRLQEKAQLLPPGAKRDAVEMKVRQLAAAARISDWLQAFSLPNNSPGHRPSSQKGKL